MATAKKATPSSASKKAVKTAAPAPKASPAAVKPVKEAFTKAGLIAHLAAHAEVEAKAVKAVLASLEATILGALHKKGQREFTLPGLLKIGVQAIPAKKKRVGIDPFTKVEREFPAKPATVRVKVRALKRLKDSAL